MLDRYSASITVDPICYHLDSNLKQMVDNHAEMSASNEPLQTAYRLKEPLIHILNNWEK